MAAKSESESKSKSKPKAEKKAKAAPEKGAKAAPEKGAKAAPEKEAKAAPEKEAKAAPEKKAKAEKKAAKKKPAAKPKAAKTKPAAAAAPAKKGAAKKAAAEAKPARSSSRKPKRILRIRLRSFDYKQVDTATESILRTVRQTGSSIRGPIPLPVSRERFDLLRSPHVYKDSREQIEIRTYHRLVDVLDPSKKTAEALSKIGLPAGVDANLKMI